MQTVHSNAATHLVTGAADGSIGLWGLDGEMVSLVQQHGSPVMLLKQGGDTLVSGEDDSLMSRCLLQGEVWQIRFCMRSMSSSSPVLYAAAGKQRPFQGNPTAMCLTSSVLAVGFCAQVLQIRTAMCGACRACCPVVAAAAVAA
jgi:hypothetical protein